MTTKKTKADTTAVEAESKAQKTKHLQHEYDPSETNWSALSFPVDPFGLTPKFRREFRNSIQRCHGSDEKFHQVVDNLEVLMAWAQAKLETDKAANQRNAEASAARAALAARQEKLRARIQAGPTIRVSATATGFVEQSPRDGSILAVYDTADDELGPVASMARMMIAEGRDPNSTLEIHAFGRPAIGSGQTLAQLAPSATSTETTARPTAAGTLRGIRS